MHAPSVSAIILDTLIKATLLLAMAGVAALVLKKRSAAARHMVQACALFALLLLPFSVMMLPAWHVKGVPGFSRSTVAAIRVAKSEARRPSAAAVDARTVRSATVVKQASSHVSVTLLATSPASRTSQMQRPAVTAKTFDQPSPAATHNTDVAAPTVASTVKPAEITPAPISESAQNLWAAYGAKFLGMIWISGALFFLARWRLNAWRLAALVQSSGVLTDSGWNAQVRALSSAMGIHRHVALLVSDELEVPITTGSVFPKIVLSPDYSEWSALRRSAILNHELAHIRRHDALTQALAQVATSLYWFHPLVWMMERAMRAERERACDDQVLAAGTRPSDYAHELLDIVSGMRGPELAAALAMARRSQLEGRVLAVLNPALPRGSVSPRVIAGVAVLTLGIVLPLAALRPAPQTSTPAATPTNKQKPSPAAKPATAPRAESGSASPTPSAEEAPRATTMDSEDATPEAVEPAEAPEPPEATVIEPADPADAPEPPAALRNGGVQGGIPGGVPNGVQGGVPVGVPGGVRIARTAPAAPSSPGIPAAPGIPSAPAMPAVGGVELSVCGKSAHLHNMNMESHDGYKRWTANWSGDDCNVDLRAEGEVKFNAEATDIQSISPGGFFEVNLRQGDTLKQVKVVPSASGLQYVYKINAKEEPFTGEARKWFSEFLLALERATGLAADARIPALLAKGGPTAVLDEISNLQSDYVRSIYFRKLLEQPNLSGPVVQRVIKQAGEQVKSDYELARVLMTVAKQYDMPDEATRTAFLTAAGSLKSDYEHARVLIELLRRPNISKENVNLALKSSAGIKSDYEKSRILLSLLEQKGFEQTQLDFYLKMVDSIQSDYEKSRDLLAPMQKYSLSTDQINRIMSATATIRSDYEKSRLLIGLSEKGKFDEAQMANYLKVVDSMTSDYERSRTLLTLMSKNSLSGPSVTKALEDMTRPGSDYEKSRVIITLVQANKFDENQMATYLRVVASISSDFERARSLLALMEHTKLSEASLAKTLEAAARIGSDHEKSRVLLAMATNYSLTGTLREGYIKAADSINSEFERNRTLAAVVKRATL